MNIRNFDLNLLVLFEALMTERNVTRAAGKMFMSQSAMSHALNRLRTLLDDPLLVRTEQGMMPTPRAQALMASVQGALRTIERALEPPQPFAPASSERRFVIAATDFFEEAIFPALMTRLRQEAPKVRVEVDFISETIAESELEKGEVDLVVGLEAFLEVPQRLRRQPWLTEELVCVVAQDNPRFDERITLEAFIATPQVAVSDVHGAQASYVDVWLAQQGLSRPIMATILNYLAAAQTVAATDYLVTLPKQVALEFAALLPLKILQPPADFPSMQMNLVYHPLFEMEPANIWLRRVVDEVAKAVLAQRSEALER